MRVIVTALTVLLVLASVAPATAAGSEAYTGTHVSFGTSANAVTDYTVDGETMLSTVQVQSASEAEGSGVVDAGASLSAVTSVEGAGVSMAAESETSATVDVDGSASMDAHDNGNGVLVVRAGGESQYVQAELDEGAEADAESDGRVTVTTADGVEGTFVVVGEGEVTVNDEGDVVAKLGEDGNLVFRAYPDGKSDDDEEQERLIADGQAVGEVHVMAENGEAVADAVAYGSDTAIEAEQAAEGTVTVTVDRAAHEGQVVITTVSESVLDAKDDLSVQVDGEAAAEASSYSELQGAIGSDQSKYLVRQSSAAEGSAQVLVAVNHFSERTITMSESDSGTATDGHETPDADGDTSGSDGDDTATDGQPGFGVVAAVMALLAAAIIAIRRG